MPTLNEQRAAMSKEKRIERRDFLAGAAAVMAQPAISVGPLLAQQAGPDQQRPLGPQPKIKPKNKPPAFITPGSNNPYFVPVGRPLEGTQPAPPLRRGTGLGPAPRASAPLGSSTLAAFLSSIFAPLISSVSAQTSSSTSTLVLYDTTGPWGWLGELYGMMTANLASHFGSWTALPVVAYSQGMLKQYTAAIYIGSTYGEPLPTAFLIDVFGSSVPVSGCTTTYGS
jgi:hypothetical protein